MPTTFAVLTALTLCTSPAAARPLETRAALVKARRLLRRARDRAALELLVKTLERGGHSPRATAQLHLLVGVARYNLGKRKAARRALRIALELDRQIRLPDDVSPKISALVEKIRATIPAKKRDEPSPRVAPREPRREAATPDQPPSDSLGFDTADHKRRRIVDTAPRDRAPPEARPGAAARTAGWILGGVAVAGVAVAVTLGVLSSSRADEANDDTVPHLRAAELHDQAESFALGSNISWGIAAASAAASALFFYLGYRGGTRVSLAPASTAGHSSVNGAIFSLQASLW